MPVRVLAVSKTFRNKRCYAVGFSDGSSVVASGDHLWTTKHAYRPWSRPRRNGSGNGGRPRIETITTEQVAQSVLRPRQDGGIEYNHKLSAAPALEMTSAILPVPPYALGVWLGNGNSSDAGITIHSGDSRHYERELALEGLGEVVIRSDARTERKASRVRLRSYDHLASFQTKLRYAEQFVEKHIPECYFSSGLAQRWALLQGLMDTDGTVAQHAGQTTPRCSFSNTNYQLACGVWRLCRSLGLKATIHEGEAKIGERSYGAYWIVAFPATRDTPVFRLERKQSLLPRALGKRSSTLTITSCERVDSVPTKCLMVDAPDNLFLVGHGCVPTHNTSLAAFLLLAHLCGPPGYQRPNSSLYSTAQSREQAAILFQLAAKIVRMSPHLRDSVIIRESAKQLHCPELGTSYRALSAEASTAYGLSPAFCVHDELGQVKGPRFPLYEALETATGAHDDPLSIIISTQAPTDMDLLSILIDDALAGHDPRTYVKLFTAPMELDPFDEKTIRMANPALGYFLNEREVLAMAEDARRMPAREAEFRNLVLNQRVEAASPFVTPSQWKACGSTPSDLHGITLYGGLDLSSVSDLTALVLIGKVGNIWHVRPTFWLPVEGLKDKAMKDRVPYDVWQQQGFLKTTPGNSVAYEYVAKELRSIFNEYKISKLAFDRWNFRHLRPWLTNAGFSDLEITDKFVEFGQGTASMSPALRDLEAAIRDKQVAHGNHPVLSMCAANAVVEGKDEAIGAKTQQQLTK